MMIKRISTYSLGGILNKFLIQPLPIPIPAGHPFPSPEQVSGVGKGLGVGVRLIIDFMSTLRAYSKIRVP
jgi:hypothetical protein